MTTLSCPILPFFRRVTARRAPIAPIEEVVGVEVLKGPLLGKKWNSLTKDQQTWLGSIGFTSK